MSPRAVWLVLAPGLVYTGVVNKEADQEVTMNANATKVQVATARLWEQRAIDATLDFAGDLDSVEGRRLRQEAADASFAYRVLAKGVVPSVLGSYPASGADVEEAQRLLAARVA